MSENGNSIKKGIIITVIGGLILVAILYLIPPLWKWLLDNLRALGNFLFTEINLSSWLFLLLLIASFYPLFKLAKKILTTIRKNIRPIDVSNEIEKPISTEKEEDKKPAFSNEEKYILTLLAKVDGRSLNLLEITRCIGCSNIRTEHALEQLESKNLVKYSHFANLYGLTSKGRELIVEIGLDKNKEAITS